MSKKKKKKKKKKNNNNQNKIKIKNKTANNNKEPASYGLQPTTHSIAIWSLHITRDGMLGIGRFGARVFCKFCPYHRHHEKLLNCGLYPIALPWGWDRNRSLAKKSWRCLSASRLQLIKKHILFQELSFLFDGFCIFLVDQTLKSAKVRIEGSETGLLSLGTLTAITSQNCPGLFSCFFGPPAWRDVLFTCDMRHMSRRYVEPQKHGLNMVECMIPGQNWS